MSSPLTSETPRRLAPHGALVIPRRVVWVLGFLALVAAVWRIQQPPVVTLQRLDSPDGTYRAFLQRTKYVNDHFRVRLEGLGPSFVAYTSPPFESNPRVDLGERLRWSEDGATVFLRIEGTNIWQYDARAGRGRDLNPDDAW